MSGRPIKRTLRPLRSNSFRCAGWSKGEVEQRAQAVDFGVEEVAGNAAPSSRGTRYDLDNLRRCHWTS